MMDMVGQIVEDEDGSTMLVLETNLKVDYMV